MNDTDCPISSYKLLTMVKKVEYSGSLVELGDKDIKIYPSKSSLDEEEYINLCLQAKTTGNQAGCFELRITLLSRGGVSSFFIANPDFETPLTFQ